MLQRLYLHNFRCLENFELTLKEMPSALLIGKNGVGKSALRSALEVLQSIGRGINRVKNLVLPKDLGWGRSEVPMRFEIEVLLDNKLYKYIVAFELPENFKELRVFEEEFIVAGEQIYSRKEAQVTLNKTGRDGYSTSFGNNEAQFLVDWHLVALPLIQERSQTDPIHIFKTWLARTIILAPIPSLMTGDSSEETLEPKLDGSNFGDWLSGLLSRYPAAYNQVYRYLQEVLPDLNDFLNEVIGKDAKSTMVRFEQNNANLSVYFKDLSDGEKCFFLGAVVLAANQFYGPLFCFWDEPENYLSLSEVGHFVLSLRRSFKNKNGGQILVTSHNPEAIQKFSDENTFVLDRKSHLEPTLIRPLKDLSVRGDLINTLICGDIEL